MKSGHSRYPFGRRALALVLAAVLVSPGPALAQSPPPALPQGGQAAQGSVTIATPSPSQMVVTQTSQRAVVNWSDFSIGSGGLVDIQQPNASAAILNRVTGGNASLINGGLHANGQVYLLNPHGIVVGPNGVIDTAAFLASILHASDSAFMAGGPLAFSGDSTAGITNLGVIHASTGDVALFAPAVANRGTIAAPNGTAALVSGSEILFAPGGPSSFLIKAPVDAGLAGPAIDNSGVIAAAQAELKAAGSPYALAVNNSGLVSATTMTRSGGRVVLDGGAGDVVNSGTLTAQAGDEGGAIDVLGTHVELSGHAVVDASGPSGGGAIRIGGGAHGADPSVTNAQTATVGPDAVIRANATGGGNGGSVVVWSDDATDFQGSIEAKGGVQGGDGGSAEVSGHTLAFGGRADLSAPAGATGTLLLDPATIDIDAATAASIDMSLDTAKVTEQATSSVTVSSPISNATTTNTLTLDAPSVAVNANINLPSGSIDFGSTGNAGTSVTSTSAATLSAKTIAVLGNYQTVNLAGPVSATSFGYVPTNSTLTSLTANNASNAIKNLNLTNGTVSLTGDVDVRSTTSMLVASKLTTAGNLTFVAGGDLAFGGGTPTLDVAGTTTLASTGGAFNDNSTLTLSGAGRKIIYSSTDGGNFNVTGLGYPQINPVSFPNDPQGSGNVIYIKTASGLPLLTITADGKTTTYGSPDPAFTASFSGGSASALTSPVLFQVSGAHSNVGTYSIVPFGATSSTFRLVFASGTLTITPAALTITANNFSRTYGAANPSFTVSASSLFNGDTLGSVVPNLSFSTPATAGSNVGTYAITPSGTSASANYTLQFVPGTLTVNPATLTISVNDVSRLYGAANPSFSANFSGLVNGDSPSVVSGLAFTTGATEKTPVGTYSVDLSGGVATNYVIVPINGTLTITPAPLTITTSSGSVVYGQPTPALTNTYSGFVAGDTAASLGLGYSTPVVPGTGVGIYQTSLTGTASNYTITYNPGSVSVTPAPLTITANDATRFQGAPNPTFTATVTGLFGTDTVNNLQFTTSATSSSPAGTYSIVPTTGRMPNYIVIPRFGILTVQEPQPPVITIDFSGTLSSVKPVPFTMPTSQPVSVSVQGDTHLSALWLEAPSVADRAIDLMAQATPGLTETAKQQLLDRYHGLLENKGDLKALGKLLPFLMQEAKDILDRDPSTWSADEKHFIDYMTLTANTQRKLAAQQAAQGLADWKREQQAEADKQGLISSITLQEVPPDKFLLEAQTGVALDDTNTRAFVSLAGGAAAAGVGAAVGVAATTVGVALVIEGTFQTLAAGAVGGAIAVPIAMIVAGVKAAIQLSNVGDYNRKMDEAVAAAQKPLTASDLKSMFADKDGQKTVFGYLAAQWASNIVAGGW